MGIVVLLVLVAYEWRLHTIVSGSREVRIGPIRQRRALRDVEAPPISAGAAWDQHSIFLLEGSVPLPLDVLNTVQSAVGRVMSAAVVTRHSGQQAAALAAAFNAAPLPSVVYFAPNCIAGVHPDCKPRVLRWPAAGSGAAPDTGRLVEWLLDVAPANLRTVNDLKEDVEFVETLPGGDRGTSVLRKPMAADWVETRLGSVWTALVNGTVVAKTTVTGDGAMAVRRPGACNFWDDLACDSLTFPATKAVIQEREDYDRFQVQLLSTQPGKVHNYTEVGFKVVKTPPLLIDALRRYFQVQSRNYSREEGSDEVTNLLVDLPETGPMRESIHAIMTPELEAWSGVRLKHSAIYGIRIYRRGSYLGKHVDIAGTHVISAIINVSQKVDEPWPLGITDHAGKAHLVPMVPGEMIMYEGSSCPHDRALPLKGDWYANIFVHMAPIEAWKDVAAS